MYIFFFVYFIILSLSQGELEHRRVKRFYSRTNKMHFTQQITKHEQRERILNDVHIHDQAAQRKATDNPLTAVLDFHDEDPLPYTSPSSHYHISESTRYPLNITAWLSTHKDDPA